MLSRLWLGFRHFPPAGPVRIFPPRLQSLPGWGYRALVRPCIGLGRKGGEEAELEEAKEKAARSPSDQLGYWYRPHTSRRHRPVVFIHGIGIGLWPYLTFLGELNAPGANANAVPDDEDGQIGILALEILPMSCRLTDPLLQRERFLADLQAVLAQCGSSWNEFVLVSHSYGSVLTTHIVKSPELGPRVTGVVLIDPVSVMLHLPDVAYNFTRRVPQRANEWQLWYFASTDLGIAEGLGRDFFWRENVVWREELLMPPEKGTGMRTGGGGSVGGNNRVEGDDAGRNDNIETRAKRRVAACLSGRDLIVDTRAVARYLACEGDMKDVQEGELDRVDEMLADRKTDTRSSSRRLLTPAGIEMLWFPSLDHAQIFEAREDRQKVADVVRRYCVMDRRDE